MNSSFWKGRKVFLTGHTGFKGAWLSLFLYELGAEVTGFSRDVPTNPSLFELARCSEILRADVRGDVREYASVKHALVDSKAEIVFHLAAQPIVRLSYADPLGTYGTNVMGTLNVLMACDETPSVRSIINVTSDKCYENLNHLQSYSEGSQLGGSDPYSSSKACSEILTESLRRSFLAAKNKNVSTVRAGNVIGGGDWGADRLVPDFIRSYRTEKKLHLRHPDSVRPWQHVLDPLSAYLLVAEKNYSDPSHSNSFNVGPSEEDRITVRALISKLLPFFPGHPGVDLEKGADGPEEADILLLDSTRIKDRLGWVSRLNLDSSLRLTGEWYQAWLAHEDMQEFCLKQIRDFRSHEPYQGSL